MSSGGSISLVGGSTGEAANVEDQALLVREYSDFDYALENGLAFSWSALTYDYAAADTILGVENRSSTHDLYIHKIIVGGDTSSQFVVHTSSGVTLAGTNAVTGVNLNRSSAVLASTYSAAYDDETGNGQAAATYSGRVWTGRILADRDTIVDVDGAIVVPYDYTIGVDITSDGAACNATIIGYFKAKD